ncbi:MAG: redoxin family protein [Alphaproteobacteria bacterium]|nr:redoxin family protein [Alphaproteobacteria bacterium]
MLSTRSPLPDATVCQLIDEKIAPIRIHDLFRDGVNILVGVPGAYTPVCTFDHIPSLIRHADQIRKMGVREIYCISDDNPWTLETWKKSIPGSQKIQFLSDGNKDFLKATRIVNDQHDYFIAGGYGRFYAVLENLMVKRIRAETTVLQTVCTSGECILSDINDVVRTPTKS